MTKEIFKNISTYLKLDFPESYWTIKKILAQSKLIPTHSDLIFKDRYLGPSKRKSPAIAVNTAL